MSADQDPQLRIHFNDEPLPVESHNGPGLDLTPEQDADYERYDKQGELNNGQILQRIGALPTSLEGEVIIDEAATANRDGVRVPQNMGRKKDGTIDRRTLSARGKIIADGPPAHIAEALRIK